MSAPRPVPGPPPSGPPRRLEPAPVLPPVPTLVTPELMVTYWNHACPHAGCGTWVPNHRRGCATHGGDT